MNLTEVVPLIRMCVDEMNARYGKTVFDEWAVISRKKETDYVLNYSGPRKEDFRKNFWTDVNALGDDFASKRLGAGDFAFAPHGVGTRFEAFLMLGTGIYLICNNTRSSMDEIARDSRWLNAQVAFVELSEKARAHPVTVDKTQTILASQIRHAPFAGQLQADCLTENAVGSSPSAPARTTRMHI